MAADPIPSYKARRIATDLRKFIRELFGLFLLFWAVLLLLSLLSFDANDPSFNLVKSAASPVHNKAGLFGAYASGFLNDIFGIGALLWPLIFGALGAAYVSRRFSFHWWRWTGFFLLTVCLLVLASSANFSLGDLSGGGMVGSTLSRNGSQYLSPVGSGILWLFIFLIGIQLAANFSWSALFTRCAAWLSPRLRLHFQNSNSSTGKLVEKFGHLGARAKKAISFFRHFSVRKLAAKFRFPRAGAPFAETHVKKAEPEQKPFFAEPASQYQFDDDPFAASQDLSRPADDKIIAQGPVSREPEADHGEETKESEIQTASPQVETAPASPEQAKAEIHAPGTASPDRENSVRREAPRPSLKLFGDDTSIALPSTELLEKADNPPALSPEQMEKNGQVLMSCFQDFDIQADLVGISPGPVITMYRVRPAPGVRGNRIANLSDDLARVLKAVAVRIQTPIPGSDTVGIEVPNERRETVNFRELAESRAFQQGCGPLTMILGKDIGGVPYMADLTDMPHLLVAGATGAGKSVCLNAILISFLYRLHPSRMRLLLIDPKRIEMAMYAGLPHLAHPVVTEMADAKNALEWAVHEMERRYKTMARLGVRDIASYNKKLAAYKHELPPDYADMEPFPYLVIVIDELADLMMTAAKDVETCIVRLAQLARAAGIHMILATQRPSVNVVTGLIKVNFPCRISFQVTSKYDSKTILDESGAEHLLGRGDMLFKPKGGQMKRLHGPFLRDGEVQTVVDYWKSKLPPSYQVDFSQWSNESGSNQPGRGEANPDPLYEEARKFVLSQDRISISLLQRYLKIGYNRSARLMEQFEQEGLLGPADGGSKPRAVIHN